MNRAVLLFWNCWWCNEALLVYIFANTGDPNSTGGMQMHNCAIHALTMVSWVPTRARCLIGTATT